ncbi:MAG: hypothetical protein ACRDRB_18815 [Pseudonocardiaceae bacterium]
MTVSGGDFAFRDARLEIGLGQPPDAFGSDAANFLADQCSPTAKITIVEVARGRVDLGVPDAAIPTTFGNRLNVWGQKDGNPPPGFTTLTNTLATPGLVASDMLLRGWSIRVLVEPEARTIPINFFTPGATPRIPGSPDAWTQNDFLNALGLANDQSMIPGDLLYGLPTWKAAYAFINAYQGAWLRNNQDALIRDPLTQMATIQPFAEAEAAGLAFSTNQDRILAANQRLVQLGISQQCMPIFQKRLGCLTSSGEGARDVGDFIVSREDDASPTIFGGIGVPTNRLTKDPYLFTQPIFWPAGYPMSFVFEANDDAYLAEMQRWLSVSGGTGGNVGQDLNLPWTNVASITGETLSPSTGSQTAAQTMLEQSLDPTPVNVMQQVPVRRALVKSGAMVFEVGLIGQRISQPWKRLVAQGVACKAIACPMGYGTLPMANGS